MRGVVAGFVLSLGCVVAVQAAESPSLADRKAAATRQRQDLRERIQAIQKDIDHQQAAQRGAADQLRASESAISDINRQLADLADQARSIERTQRSLDAEMGVQRTLLARRRAELADQLRAQYADGLSPWTALLSGNDPQAIGRDLSYLGYVSRARAETVRGIQKALGNLADLRRQSEAQGRRLAEVRKDTSQRKVDLQTSENQRQQVLSRIEAQLKAQRAQANHMARDEKHLGGLIQNLDKAIAAAAEAARRAEAERQAEAARKAEAARQARAARLAREQAEQARRRAEAAQADQARRQVEAAAQAEKANQQAQAVRQRAQIEQAGKAQEQAQSARTETAREASSVRRAPERAPEGTAPRGGFHGLGRGLPYPVRGEVQGRFGASRPDGGGVWRGIVLRAPEGTPVHVIAAGRVVYANWLSGFGNIMIVDHGGGYMSIYAYNQTLLKRVGDIVQAGETIATVGSTGGQVESGLYFEIRRDGAPVNPLLWLKH
ncbi:MAG TPA: peptidoglycan DD-metalloendopeptidase family protein [Burkholderiaceae bacterium]|nr:peptidoglycan DD-metalloendopeptidase family protein [Burkholderiaceae bacterium]